MTAAGGRVKYRQVQLEVITPEALILGKEEYHIQQVGTAGGHYTLGSHPREGGVLYHIQQVGTAGGHHT